MQPPLMGLFMPRHLFFDRKQETWREIVPSAPPYFRNKETKEGLMTPPPSFKNQETSGLKGILHRPGLD